MSEHRSAKEWRNLFLRLDPEGENKLAGDITDVIDALQASEEHIGELKNAIRMLKIVQQDVVDGALKDVNDQLIAMTKRAETAEASRTALRDALKICLTYVPKDVWGFEDAIFMPAPEGLEEELERDAKEKGNEAFLLFQRSMWPGIFYNP